MAEKLTTNTILMVRPAHFGFNPETAENNVFQKSTTRRTKDEISRDARKEFDEMVLTLRENGVDVIVISDTDEPYKTDAVFPNNWISTHEDGRIYTFPMFSPNRRLERRQEIIDLLKEDYKVILDESMLSFEKDDLFLEGTGSMILDRPNKIIYACLSERTDQKLLDIFGKKIGYDVVAFHAVDENNIPYYHTNVIMTIGEKVAIICTESIVNKEEKLQVISRLKETGKTVVDITREQVLEFAGNMLEIATNDEKNLFVMSSAAYNSLKEEQRDIIKSHNKIVHLRLNTIEKFGGGSARCMIAEVFLPKIV